VARCCSHIAVMYGGRVVESGPTSNVLGDPLHPYTRALLSALPGEERPGQRLDAIAGAPPVLLGPAPGCAFAARCPSAVEHCQVERPHYDIVNDCTLCCHLVSSGTITATRESTPSSVRLARSLLPPIGTERRNDD
jgi:oligopeptide/dipeptide ABC transporter ATP-binding protein